MEGIEDMTNWQSGWANQGTIFLPDRRAVITPFSPCSVIRGDYGWVSVAGADVVWAVADRALYIPFTLSRSMTMASMFVFNGTVVNGNFDMGIYDEWGARLASLGSTVQAGINTYQNEALVATFGPGIFYMALVFDGVVARTYSSGMTAINMIILGCAIEANAFPLPAVATFATNLEVNIPWFGLTERSFL